MNPVWQQVKEFTDIRYEKADGIAKVTINRPEKKNPLTFDSYAGLRDLFRNLQYASDVRAVVFSG